MNNNLLVLQSDFGLVDGDGIGYDWSGFRRVSNLKNSS